MNDPRLEEGVNHIAAVYGLSLADDVWDAARPGHALAVSAARAASIAHTATLEAQAARALIAENAGRWSMDMVAATVDGIRKEENRAQMCTELLGEMMGYVRTEMERSAGSVDAGPVKAPIESDPGTRPREDGYQSVAIPTDPV